MIASCYEIDIQSGVRDTEAVLVLALVAVESLYGCVASRMAARYRYNAICSRCTIDTSTEAGAALAKIFCGIMIHRHGRDSVIVNPSESRADMTERLMGDVDFHNYRWLGSDERRGVSGIAPDTKPVRSRSKT